MSCIDTVLPADVVEFCPHPDHQNLLACGTYKIEDSQNIAQSIAGQNSTASHQRRRGTCLIYKAVVEGESHELLTLQEIQLPAVLDLKWCHSTTTAIFAVADSEGHVSLYEWQGDEMKLANAVDCATSDVLCLSLDWSSRRFPASDAGSLIVSLSNGYLCLLRPVAAAGLLTTDSWMAHEYEPWSASWDYWDTNIVYSGGDDLTMKGWDLRQGFVQPTFINNRFDGGVTAIQSHPHIEHCIAVGSYDNTVRIFDARKPAVPLVRVDVGGGAWRVKWHPSAVRKNDLLVACMHDGFKIIRVKVDQASGDVVKHYTAHQSLAYGADWSFADGDNNHTMIATCSFYDNALHLWHG